MSLPQSIRDRTPAPHALRVWTRRAELPAAAELGQFCEFESVIDQGPSWIRLSGRDTILVLLEEGADPIRPGFDHALRVESGRSKACFLAAYFIARRLGGVVQVRQKSAVLPAAAFAERFLGDEDLESRWSRTVAGP